MILAEAIKSKLEDNYLGTGDVRVFARPDPTGSGSFKELQNPLTALLQNADRFNVVFVGDFKDVDWKRRGIETDLMAIGAVTPWVIWAKDTFQKCPHCRQPIKRD